MARARKPPSNCGTSVAEIQGQLQLFFWITMLTMLLVLYETVGLKNLCKGVLDSGILKTTQVADFWGGPFSRLPTSSLGPNGFLETSSSRVAMYSLK